MFAQLKKGFKKDGLDIRALAEKRFQEEAKKKLIAWQIENKIVIQPVLQPTVDSLRASLIFVSANDKQIKSLKDLLK